MPLDRVHTEDEATRDLAVGGTLKQQSQHLALASREPLRDLGALSRRDLDSAMKGHVLAKTSLMATYEKRAR